MFGLSRSSNGDPLYQDSTKKENVEDQLSTRVSKDEFFQFSNGRCSVIVVIRALMAAHSGISQLPKAFHFGSKPATFNALRGSVIDEQ